MNNEQSNFFGNFRLHLAFFGGLLGYLGFLVNVGALGVFGFIGLGWGMYSWVRRSFTSDVAVASFLSIFSTGPGVGQWRFNLILFAVAETRNWGKQGEREYDRRKREQGLPVNPEERGTRNSPKTATKKMG